jgi:ring-1,2-phenylacetyl-CoA epoxidase subunit PaaC
MDESKILKMPSETTNNAKNDLVDYTLFLADSSLIMGHRLSEWTGHGPMIEQDIALTNIALDLIGQSRNFYQYAAELIDAQNDKKTTEDDLAYLRDANEFKNLLIAELPNGDWAFTICKLFFFSTWQFYLYQKLINSKDEQLAAIAEKSLKEVTYHVRWSGDWIIRLGDGTDESKKRMEKAIAAIWPYTGEMFIAADFEDNLKNSVSIDVSSIKDDWLEKVKLVFAEATLSVPEKMWMQSGGKNGVHTEHLGYILAEMQFMQRAYPGLEW